MPRSCDLAFDEFQLLLGNDVQRAVLFAFSGDPSCPPRMAGDAGLRLRDRLGQAQERKPCAAGGAFVDVDSAHQAGILARDM